MQRIKVGDLVQVIAGKEKGKRGTVKRILKDETT
jgi:ribosomal protein L24